MKHIALAGLLLPALCNMTMGQSSRTVVTSPTSPGIDTSGNNLRFLTPTPSPVSRRIDDMP